MFVKPLGSSKIVYDLTEASTSKASLKPMKHVFHPLFYTFLRFGQHRIELWNNSIEFVIERPKTSNGNLEHQTSITRCVGLSSLPRRRKLSYLSSCFFGELLCHNCMRHNANKRLMDVTKKTWSVYLICWIRRENDEKNR